MFLKATLTRFLDARLNEISSEYLSRASAFGTNQKPVHQNSNLNMMLDDVQRLISRWATTNLRVPMTICHYRHVRSQKLRPIGIGWSILNRRISTFSYVFRHAWIEADFCFIVGFEYLRVHSRRDTTMNLDDKYGVNRVFLNFVATSHLILTFGFFFKISLSALTSSWLNCYFIYLFELNS